MMCKCKPPLRDAPNYVWTGRTKLAEWFVLENWLLTITEAIEFDVIVLYCFLWDLTKLLTLMLAQSQEPLLQKYVV